MIKQRIFQCAFVSALVYLSSKLPVLAGPPGVFAFWPPAGLALSALLLGGGRLWPGILLGAFVSALDARLGWAMTLMAPFVVLIQALIGSLLIKRYAKGVEFPDSVQTVFKALVVIILVTMSTSAVGAAVLFQVENEFNPWVSWRRWCLSDLTGILVVAPFIVVWCKSELTDVGPSRRLEAAGLIVALLAIASICFGSAGAAHPQAYIVLPAMLWVSLRFRQRGAVSAIAIVAALATYGTMRRVGPFVAAGMHESILSLQIYLCTTCPMALLVAAIMSERHWSEQRLRLQSEVGRVLSESTSSKEASSKLLERIEERLGWDMGIYWEIVLDKAVLSCTQLRSALSKSGESNWDANALRVSQDMGLIGKCWQTGVPQWTPNISEKSRDEVTDFAAQAGMQSCFVFPVRVGGMVVGLAAFFGKQPKRLDHETIEICAAIGDRLGQFLDRKQAETALRSSESQLRLVWESSIEGMRLVDEHGTIRAVNDTYCKMMGRTREDLVGQRVWTLQQPDRALELMQNWAESFRNRSFGNRIEKSLVLANGKTLQLELVNCFLEEHPPLLLTVFRDVTERKRAESLRQEFSLLAQQLSAATTPGEAARALADAAQKLISWDGCLVDLYSAEANKLSNILAVDTVDGERKDVSCCNPQGEITPRVGRAIKEGGFLLLHENLAKLPPPVLPFGDMKRRSASIIFVPIRHQKRVTGVLSLHSYQLKAYTQTDLDTVQALADHCGGALERIRVAEELHNQQALLRTVFDMAPSLISVKDQNGRYRFLNRAHAAFFGKTVDSVINRTDIDLELQPEEAAHFQKDDQEVLKTGQDKLIWEERCTDSQGQVHWLQTIKRPLPGPDGNPAQVLAISLDVTERKRVERRNAAFLKLAQRLHYAISGTEAARVVAEVADELFGWDAFTLNLYSLESGETMVEPVLNVDVIDGKRREIPILKRSGRGKEPHWRSVDNQGELILKQEPISMSPGLTSFGDASRPSASLMFVPIRTRACVLGVISAHSYKLNAYTREDLNVFQALADYCGAALDRIRAENALRESDALKGAIMESALDCIITTNREGRIMELNSAAQSTFGFSRAQVIGKELAQIIFPPVYRDAYRNALGEYAETGDLKLLGRREEIIAVRADGSEFPAELAVTPLHADNGPIFTAYLRDITERKRTEKAMREIPGRILQAQESERMRVARELHDSVNQILSSTKFRLDSIEETEVLASVPAENLVKARELLDRAMHEIWRISRNLRPSELDDLGLVPAVRSLCHEFEDRTGVAVILELPEQADLSPESELILYRIIQEALNNVEKHSEATEVKLQLSAESHWMLLCMQDNGIGFKHTQTGIRRKAGMGLLGMKERAAFVGGTVEIDSSSQQGTTIQVRIPTEPA